MCHLLDHMGFRHGSSLARVAFCLGVENVGFEERSSSSKEDRFPQIISGLLRVKLNFYEDFSGKDQYT